MIEYGLPQGWWAGSLHGPGALSEAEQLYRGVFAYQGQNFSLNPMLLHGMAHNGGSMIGVRNEVGELVGFAYGFVGRDAGETFHYSQAAVVSPILQGRGVGRALKLAQREVVLADGLTEMRWAFDPAYARNGHFNFDKLGARGFEFFTDFYETPGTDRLIAKWDLTAPAQRVDLKPSFGDDFVWGEALPADADKFWVPVPASLVAGAHNENEHHQRARLALRDTLNQLVTQEHRAVLSCQKVNAATSAYLIGEAQ